MLAIPITWVHVSTNTPFLVLLLIQCGCAATALSERQQCCWCGSRLGSVGTVWAVHVGSLGDSQCGIFVVRQQNIRCGNSVPCAGVGVSVQR